MNNISTVSKLSFFKAEKNSHGVHTFDASCSPRPHFCMAVLLKGKAVFTDCTGQNEKFELYPGEMVFVPVTNRYISNWYGDVEYISLHFLFEYPSVMGKNNNFKLQKLTFPNSGMYNDVFERILDSYCKDEKFFETLSLFYRVLSEVIPSLECGEARPIDPRISDAVSFIEEHYTERITVERLAVQAKMSASRFFPCFKSSLGVTPVDYLNHFRISKAIVMIVNRPDLSVDEISLAVGFESSTYFRRVFKLITGKTPRDYRKLKTGI